MMALIAVTESAPLVATVNACGAIFSSGFSSGVFDRILVGLLCSVNGVLEHLERDRVDDREDEDDAGDVEDELVEGERFRRRLRATSDEELDEFEDES